MNRLNELRETFNLKVTELEGLAAKSQSGPLTAEEQQRLVALDGEIEALKSDIEQCVAQAAILAKATEHRALVTATATTIPHPSGSASANGSNGGGHPDTSAASGGERKSFAIPRGGGVRHFQDSEGRTKEEKAYDFGMWWLATRNFKNAQSYCTDKGLDYQTFVALSGHQTKVQMEAVAEAGGYLVPTILADDLIDLKEVYGVARRIFDVWPMGSETVSVPRVTGGPTAYFVNEDTAPTESEMSFDQIMLVAKEVALLSFYSMSLGEDAILNIGDKLANRMAYELTKLEDTTAFVGNGLSAHGGIVGLTTKILSLSATRANIAGLIVASGPAITNIELLDFHAVLGRLPAYANTANARWCCHKSFYHNVMERLMFEQGGVTVAEMMAGSRQQRFLGYPVEFVQVMPSATAVDTIFVTFGDHSMGATFGDRRQITIATSPHVQFAKRQMAVLASERYDVNVHDVGNASATAADRVPGPIVALATAAS